MATKEDVEKAVHGTLLWDTRLYEALISALEARQRFEKAEGPHPPGEARLLVHWAINLAALVVGRDALAEAYGDDPPQDAPADQHLLAMWERLYLISNLYDSAPNYNRRSPSSLDTLANEIISIAHGDKATVLKERAQVQGRQVNAWRLAKRQLAALEWDAHLRATGLSPAEVQIRITAAFVGQTWDTIRKWRGPVIKLLGQVTLDRALASAARGYGQYSRVGYPGRPVEECLKADGEAYREERRRAVTIAGKD